MINVDILPHLFCLNPECSWNHNHFLLANIAAFKCARKPFKSNLESKSWTARQDDRLCELEILFPSGPMNAL